MYNDLKSRIDNLDAEIDSKILKLYGIETDETRYFLTWLNTHEGHFLFLFE
jgi:predicted transport protein